MHESKVSENSLYVHQYIQFMTQNSVQQEDVEKFQQRMTQTLNDATTALMLSVGDRTGLLDVMNVSPPSTIDEISKKSQLNKRYVQEWLNGLVTAKVIHYDPEKNTYHLPPEYGMVISSQAGLGNIAFFMQSIKDLAAVEDEIVDAFINGGGVSYDHPHGRDVLRTFNSWTEKFMDASLIDVTIPLVDGLVEKLHSGIKVLDLGCGYGYSSVLLAKHFPNSEIMGLDISEEGIKNGNRLKTEHNLDNLTFKIENAEEMPYSEAFDFIVAFDSIHDQAKPALVLKNINHALKEDGTFLMVDIKASSNVEENMDHPMGPFMYTVSTFHCMTVSLAAGGTGLGSMWGRQMAESMLKECGFSEIEVKDVETDPFNSYFICKK